MIMIKSESQARTSPRSRAAAPGRRHAAAAVAPRGFTTGVIDRVDRLRSSEPREFVSPVRDME